MVARLRLLLRVPDRPRGRRGVLARLAGGAGLIEGELISPRRACAAASWPAAVHIFDK